MDGVIIYGVVPGKHPELLPLNPPISITKDGFIALGVRNPLLDVYTQGNITVFPLTSVQENTFLPLPIPAPPGDTSLEAACRVANSPMWSGIMPFAVTGRVDDFDHIIPNNWTADKRKFLASHNLSIAGNSKAADFQMPDINTLLEYLAIGDSNSKSLVKYYHPHSGHIGKTYAADQEFDQIMADRPHPIPAPRTHIGGAGVASHAYPLHGAIEWLERVTQTHPSILTKLTEFSHNDPTGRIFSTILEHSTPKATVGPTQQDAQRAKAQRLMNTMVSLGVPQEMVTFEWIRDNGFRGPTAVQIQSLKHNIIPPPDPTIGNREGETKKGTLPVPISTNKVDTSVAQKIAFNALGAIHATPDAVEAVVEYMAMNGGKGLNQTQTIALRDTFKPKGRPPPPGLKKQTQLAGIAMLPKAPTRLTPTEAAILDNMGALRVGPPVAPKPILVSSPVYSQLRQAAGFRTPVGQSLD